MTKTLVIKYGGVALNDSGFEEILQAQKDGYHPVIIHGGGKEVTELSLQLGVRSVFKNGLRVTDATTMDIVQMVLLGRVNTRLVASLQSRGMRAIGISGLAKGVALSEDLGHVGQVERCDEVLLRSLCDQSYIPIIAPLAIGADGKIYNVNADSFAAAIAIALKSERLFLMTDVDGVYLDKDVSGSKFPHLSADVAKSLVVKDGMIPKLKAAVQAIEKGVNSVLIGKSLEANTVVTA